MNRAHLLGPVLLLALLPSNVVSAAMPLLLREWQAPNADGGIVFAAYQVGYVLSVLLVLPLTDRVGAGKVIIACALVTALSFILFPFLAINVLSASVLRLCAGLGLAGIYLPGVRIIAAGASARRRGLAVGVYVAAFYLGSAASLWATGALLSSYGWRGAALALALASVAAVPLALFATRGLPPAVENNRKLPLPSRERVGVRVASAPPTGRLDLSALRDPAVARNVMAYAGHSWELYVSRGWLAAFVASVLVAQGSDALSASAGGSQWAALMAGFGTPGVLLGGWLSDRFGRARTALAITLLSGALSLVFGFLGTGPWALLLAAGCLYGLLVSADSAVYSTAITELAAPARLGSAQALQAFFGFSATIVAPVAAGKALDLGWGWGAIFVLAGAVGLLLGAPLIRDATAERRKKISNIRSQNA